MDRAGRIKVKDDLSIPDHDNVFVVGDMASLEVTPGKIVPGLAPAAMQEGRHAAKAILSSIRGKQRPAFRYIDKGQMATIGKYRAVMQSGRLKMSGRLAWLAWLFVHVFYLIGFKNRVAVMAQWAWSYIFSKRGARLITERQWKLKD
jgi:NADH dehydrogenase